MRLRTIVQLVLSAMVWLVLLVIVTSSTAAQDVKTGSRSIIEREQATIEALKLGNTYAQRRDFRSTLTSVQESHNIDHLIGGPVGLLTLAVGLLSEGEKKRKSLGVQKKSGRFKRERPWIVGNFDKADSFLKMHAFVVRDENVPDCFEKADKYSKTRYFMCSGIVLNENRVLTSASCINRAIIYENHLNNTALAVLIGALDTSSYVIGIKSYKIHPRYKPNPASIDHAMNNIAVLMLSCSIPKKSLFIPILPSDPNADFGHMCCPNRCRLLTVVESLTKNELTVQSMDLKYLPPPEHNKNDSSSRYAFVSSATPQFKRFSRFNSYRRNIEKREDSLVNDAEGTTPTNSQDDVKETSTLVEVNTETTTGAQDITMQDTTVEQNDGQGVVKTMGASQAPASVSNEQTFTTTSQEIATTTTEPQDFTTKNVNLTDDDATKIDARQDTSAKSYAAKNYTVESNIPNSDGNANIENSDKALATVLKNNDNQINWDDINRDVKYKNTSEENKKKLKGLVENVMSELTTQISSIMVQSMANVESTFRDIQKVLKKNISSDNANEIVLSYAAKIVLESLLEKLNLKINDFITTTMSEPPGEDIKRNINCPPLGSPIISNNTLVGLIAYTCDELQNWVEWQYVEISSNIDFIRPEMENDRLT